MTSKLITEIIKRKIGRTIIVYLGSAWILIEASSYFARRFNWTEFVEDIIFLVLVFGLPASIIYAWFHVKQDAHKFSKFEIGLYSVTLAIASFFIYQSFTSFENVSGNVSNMVVANMDKSIAVKPFDNESTDEENLFFVNGMMEDIRNNLAKISDLRVISKTSSEKYRNSVLTTQEIGKELSINYLLEGTVQKIGNQIKIHAQLISTKNDDHIWQDTYLRDITDIKEVFNVQSEIAKTISAQLNVVISPTEKEQIETIPTDNAEAYNSYLLGRFHWNKRTFEGYEKSITYFEKAISIDPEFGLAYAGLADTYNLMALQGPFEDRKSNRNKAVELATKALKLDGQLAEAHNVLGSIYTFADWNWEAAEKEYLEAIRLNPNYPTVHHYYSQHLYITGRHQEARTHINKALGLDPLSFVIHFVSLENYYDQGLFEEALIENQRCHELANKHPWLPVKDFFINYRLNKDHDALEGFKEYARSENLFEPNELDSIYQKSGFDGLFKLSVDRINFSILKAVFYSLLGEDEKALDMLEQHYEPYINSMFEFKHLHFHPRFIELQKKIGLHPSQLSF